MMIVQQDESANTKLKEMEEKIRRESEEREAALQEQMKALEEDRKKQLYEIKLQ